MPKLLIVDDDPRLRNMLQRYLEEQGFDARAVGDAAHMDRLLQREHFDLLLLDVLMPEEDGLSVCRRLRQTSPTLPIIMLTARGELPDKVLGLELGADDYLSKPFEPRELVARIRAVLRRSDGETPSATPAPGEIRFGPFRLDLGERRLYRAGETIDLTSGEFALLHALASHPYQTLSREHLQVLLTGGSDASERSIDAQISRLRRLIEDNPRRPRYLQTVWGLGYAFSPSPGDHASETSPGTPPT
ncbi:response regulator [Acidihalobacter prosperus]|uniref:DNA-binding response regulator n=1 Tax=Acidihalobacter prosperus TaxID=160660 RepID=A0A1A6C8S3_9GAMM|nr:response regulator [Acidihalobacter prosperus]OBS10956.1 DNA-binding response regulator [Acidihalobacter prosperus]